MSHTKEPCGINDDGTFISIVSGDTTVLPDMRREFALDDFKRIVACVNWCKGNSTEGMIRAVGIGWPYTVARDKATHRELELTMQHNELVEAIRMTLEENSHLADGDVCTLKRLKDALAKVDADGTVADDHTDDADAAARIAKLESSLKIATDALRKLSGMYSLTLADEALRQIEWGE